jgi:Uma2 family endonuclease
MRMPAPPRSFPKRWTAYEVRALMEASPMHWPRYEVVDGELLVTPAPRLAHQKALELFRDILKPYIVRHRLGEVFGAPADLELETDTIVQPDLFVVPATRTPAREWTDVHTLLLAIEVLSPSSRRHDRLTKRRFFQRVAVPEYWVVDLELRVVERWTPASDPVERLSATLVWHPTNAVEPLVIDLAALFASIAGA